MWCSLPSPYGPSFHLCVVAPPQCFLYPPPLCGFLSPLLCGSFSYPKLKSHTQISEFIPINPIQLSCPKSREFDQGGDLLCTSVGLVGSFYTAVLCRSWGLVIGITQFHRLVSGSMPLLVRFILPLLFAVIVLGHGLLVVLGRMSCQAVVSFNLSMRLLA